MLEEFKNVRKIDKAIFYFFVIGCFVLLYVLCRTAPTDNNINATISTIKQQQREAINEAGKAGAGIAEARQAATAASDRISRSQDIVRQSTEQLSECRNILRECQELADANRAIIAEVGAGNSIGKKKE